MTFYNVTVYFWRLEVNLFIDGPEYKKISNDLKKFNSLNSSVTHADTDFNPDFHFSQHSREPKKCKANKNVENSFLALQFCQILG